MLQGGGRGRKLSELDQSPFDRWMKTVVDYLAPPGGVTVTLKGTVVGFEGIGQNVIVEECAIKRLGRSPAPDPAVPTSSPTPFPKGYIPPCPANPGDLVNFKEKVPFYGGTYIVGYELNPHLTTAECRKIFSREGLRFITINIENNSRASFLGGQFLDVMLLDQHDRLYRYTGIFDRFY